MSTLGCDIAWQKPSGAQLAAAGVRFASLYVGQDQTGKNMTPQVVADYAAHGVWTVTNFEYGAQQMLGGAAQGAIDAQLALFQARACGMPPGRPIIYSADFAATSAQITGSVIPYLVAARAITGPGTVGVYGSYAVVTAVAAYWAQHYPGERVYLWQTVAWSNSAWDSAAEIRQPGGTITVGGIALDIDYADQADYGQWQPGMVPAAALQSTHQEDDMLILRIQGDTAVWALSGSRCWHVQDEASLSAYIAAGVPQATVTQGELQGIQAATPQPAPVDAAALGAAIAAGIKIPAPPTSYTVTAA